MDQRLQDTLAKALAWEKQGNWVDAVARRNEALDLLLARTERTPTPRPLDPTDSLETLGEVHKPSKRSHDYLHRYWKHFRDVQFTARKVVEVGVQTERSINMWEEFFPNATIFGLDIDPVCQNYAGGRKKIFIGDQTDERFQLEFIKETGGDFDIVIDDGLHSTYSMLKTFSYLYPALNDHGIYVIEDVQKKPAILQFLAQLMEFVNYMPPDFDLLNWPGLSAFGDSAPWLARNTIGVSFHRYIAFIERGFNPRDNRYLIEAEEFQRRVREQQDGVRAAAEELELAGLPVTQESLVAKLGRRSAHHVDRYLKGKG